MPLVHLYLFIRKNTIQRKSIEIKLIILRIPIEIYKYQNRFYRISKALMVAKIYIIPIKALVYSGAKKEDTNNSNNVNALIITITNSTTPLVGFSIYVVQD